MTVTDKGSNAAGFFFAVLSAAIQLKGHLICILDQTGKAQEPVLSYKALELLQPQDGEGLLYPAIDWRKLAWQSH